MAVTANNPKLLQGAFEGDANSTENLIAIGVKRAETGPLPELVKNIQDVMELLNHYYPMTHRNFAEGEGVTTHKHGDKHYVVIFNTPYPWELLYGYVWGLVKRFSYSASSFTVRHLDQSVPNESGEVMDIVLE
jgi:hypothetical protein